MTSENDTCVHLGTGRVLILAPDPTISGPVPGPIGMLAHRLARALREASWEVDVELWGRHAREEHLAGRVSGRFGDLVRIRRRMATNDYDLVLVNTTHDSRALLRDLMLVIPSPRRVRWVLLIHGSHFAAGRPYFDMAARWLVGRAAAVLLLSSEEVAEWTRFRPGVRYRLVANALAPREESVSDEMEPESRVPEVLFVGRLIREKGIYELLEAFASLLALRPCRLTFAGEGPEACDLEAAANKLGLAEDVEFTGHLSREDVARLYRRAAVLALPSYSEGLPTVLLEAMSAGLPIVTTRIRGAADHLEEGTNALFVPVRSTDALASALRRLLDDESLREEMGRANVVKAEEFAPARVAEAYVRVFDEVIGRKDQH